jgi:hypothetical protein
VYVYGMRYRTACTVEITLLVDGLESRAVYSLANYILLNEVDFSIYEELPDASSWNLVSYEVSP